MVAPTFVSIFQFLRSKESGKVRAEIIAAVRFLFGGEGGEGRCTI